jgi:hypothetical protein
MVQIVADAETRRYSSFLGLDLPGVFRYDSSHQLVPDQDLCGACCALVSDI